MITFKNINGVESEILYNGIRIGYLSKHLNPAYEVTIGADKPMYFPASQKHLVKGVIERVWGRERERQKKEFRLEHKLRNSIYNTGEKFKVLG